MTRRDAAHSMRVYETHARWTRSGLRTAAAICIVLLAYWLAA